jgi:hypothetical protein
MGDTPNFSAISSTTGPESGCNSQRAEATGISSMINKKQYNFIITHNAHIGNTVPANILSGPRASADCGDRRSEDFGRLSD